MTLLVTGFGPFPGVPDNPTAELARRADALPGVVGRVLDTQWKLAWPQLRAALEEIRPDALLMFGVAVQRDEIQYERRARNWCGGRPDEAGACLPAGPLIEGAPDALATRLPLDCAASDDAGDYLCNALFFHALHLTDLPCGFVHIPPDGLEAALALLAHPIGSSGDSLG